MHSSIPIALLNPDRAVPIVPPTELTEQQGKLVEELLGRLWNVLELNANPQVLKFAEKLVDPKLWTTKLTYHWHRRHRTHPTNVESNFSLFQNWVRWELASKNTSPTWGYMPPHIRENPEMWLDKNTQAEVPILQISSRPILAQQLPDNIYQHPQLWGAAYVEGQNSARHIFASRMTNPLTRRQLPGGTHAWFSDRRFLFHGIPIQRGDHQVIQQVPEPVTPAEVLLFSQTVEHAPKNIWTLTRYKDCREHLNKMLEKFPHLEGTLTTACRFALKNHCAHNTTRHTTHR